MYETVIISNGTEVDNIFSIGRNNNVKIGCAICIWTFGLFEEKSCSLLTHITDKAKND